MARPGVKMLSRMNCAVTVGVTGIVIARGRRLNQHVLEAARRAARAAARGAPTRGGTSTTTRAVLLRVGIAGIIVVRSRRGMLIWVIVSVGMESRGNRRVRCELRRMVNCMTVRKVGRMWRVRWLG